MTLLCVCGVDSFIPELEHFIEKRFHGLFSRKKPLKSDSWIRIHEMKLRSTWNAEENFADEITWITWKTKQDLEMKIDLATGVRDHTWLSGSGGMRVGFLTYPWTPNLVARWAYHAKISSWYTLHNYLSQKGVEWIIVQSVLRGNFCVVRPTRCDEIKTILVNHWRIEHTAEMEVQMKKSIRSAHMQSEDFSTAL